MPAASYSRFPPPLFVSQRSRNLWVRMYDCITRARRGGRFWKWLQLEHYPSLGFDKRPVSTATRWASLHPVIELRGANDGVSSPTPSTAAECSSIEAHGRERVGMATQRMHLGYFSFNSPTSSGSKTEDPGENGVPRLPVDSVELGWLEPWDAA